MYTTEGLRLPYGPTYRVPVYLRYTYHKGSRYVELALPVDTTSYIITSVANATATSCYINSTNFPDTAMITTTMLLLLIATCSYTYYCCAGLFLIAVAISVSSVNIECDTITSSSCYSVAYQLAGLVVCIIILTEVIIFCCFFGAYASNAIALSNNILDGNIIGSDTTALAYTNSLVLAVIAVVASVITIAIICTSNSIQYGPLLATMIISVCIFMVLTITEFLYTSISISDNLIGTSMLGTIGLHYSHVAMLLAIISVTVVSNSTIGTVLYAVLYSHLVEVLWITIVLLVYQ